MDVKEIREAMGLSQQELAVKLGMVTSTIAKWEAGDHKPSRTSKRKLSNILANYYEGLELEGRLEQLDGK